MFCQHSSKTTCFFFQNFTGISSGLHQLRHTIPVFGHLLPDLSEGRGRLQERRNPAAGAQLPGCANTGMHWLARGRTREWEYFMPWDIFYCPFVRLGCFINFKPPGWRGVSDACFTSDVAVYPMLKLNPTLRWRFFFQEDLTSMYRKSIWNHHESNENQTCTQTCTNT